MHTIEKPAVETPHSAETTLEKLRKKEAEINEKLMSKEYFDKKEFFAIKQEVAKLTNNWGDSLHGDHWDEAEGIVAIRNCLRKMGGTEYGSDLKELVSVIELREEAERQVHSLHQSA